LLRPDLPMQQGCKVYLNKMCSRMAVTIYLLDSPCEMVRLLDFGSRNIAAH
jgi:hypothetical protein